MAFLALSLVDVGALRFVAVCTVSGGALLARERVEERVTAGIMNLDEENRTSFNIPVQEYHVSNLYASVSGTDESLFLENADSAPRI